MTIEGDFMFLARIKHTMPEITSTIKLLGLNYLRLLLDDLILLRQRS